MKPDPYVDFVDWANENFRLTKESSVEPGQYRTSRTPWVEEILRELSPQSPATDVVAIKPTQMAFTTVANIFLCAIADRYPGPAMFAQPTDDMAKKHSKKKLAPTIKVIPALKNKIKPAKGRDSGNTLLLKEFPGGSWTLTGSNSPASARSDSIRYLILDDYNGFAEDAGGEGAPGDLLRNRTDAFGNKKKIYTNSTPTDKGASKIDAEYKESSQGEYNVPCPHCGKFQYLIFGSEESEHGIKFERDEDGQISDVWYICKHCHGRIEEWQKSIMLENAKYIHKFPNRRKRGFKINSLYSPLGWVSWRQVVEEFIKAARALKRGDSRLMKKWTNTRMAESYEEDGEQPEWTKLQGRAEPYKIMTIPMGGLMLVAAVDTQDDRLEVLIEAYGREEESWTIYHGVLYGDPDRPEVWTKLDELLFRSYLHESGAEMLIESMGVDTGGHRTQAVYNYCRKRGPVVFALKGANQYGRPIITPPTKQDVNYNGKKIKGGVMLWNIGTDIAKGTIYNRLKLVKPGPGYAHFPIGLPDEFYKQLTAEKLVTGYDKRGFSVKKWVKVRERNEILDCKGYGYAAALKAGLSRRDWDQIEKALLLTRQPEQKIHRSQKPAINSSPLKGRNINPHNRR